MLGAPPLDEGVILLPDLPGKHRWNPLGRWLRYLRKMFLLLPERTNTAGGLTLLNTWVEFPGVTHEYLALWGLAVGMQIRLVRQLFPRDEGLLLRCARPEMVVLAF